MVSGQRARGVARLVTGALRGGGFRPAAVATFGIWRRLMRMKFSCNASETMVSRGGGAKQRTEVATEYFLSCLRSCILLWETRLGRWVRTVRPVVGAESDV